MHLTVIKPSQNIWKMKESVEMTRHLYSGLMAYVDCSFVLVFFVSFFCCRCCSKKDRNQNHLLPLLAAQWYSFEGKLAMVLLPVATNEKKVESSEHPLHYDILATLQLFLLHRTMSSRWRASLMSTDWRKTIHWPHTFSSKVVFSLFLNGF